MNVNKTRWTEQLIKERVMEVANTFDPVRMPSRIECEEYYGNTSLTNKLAKTGGFYHWAEVLGLNIKKSDTKFGIRAEKHAYETLIYLGFDVELTSTKHPYDLLVNNAVKIDVKAANISYANGFAFRSYRIAKKQPTCDIYMLYEADDDEIGDVYIVPSSVVSGQVQIGISKGSKRYLHYKNRYDIIQKFVDFYKSIE